MTVGVNPDSNYQQSKPKVSNFFNSFYVAIFFLKGMRPQIGNIELYCFFNNISIYNS